MSKKVILKVPGYSNTTFDSYQDLNFIWEVLDNFDNCKLQVIDTDTEDKVSTNDVDITTNTTETKIEETVTNLEFIPQDYETTATLIYDVPKSVTFTQRFQDRIKKEINDILNAVYPNQFTISDIGYQDIDNESEDMKMIITISVIDANDEIAIKNIHYLDKNVEYILKDIIDYYI